VVPYAGCGSGDQFFLNSLFTPCEGSDSVSCKLNEAQQDSDAHNTERNNRADYGANHTKRKTRDDYGKPGDELCDEELEQGYNVPYGYRKPLYEHHRID
jgi:hypothetical protein